MKDCLCLLRTAIAIIMVLHTTTADAYYVKKYSTSDGIISNNVYHALRDSKGYLWFFTEKGVSKFDGKSFINFTINDGLSDHDIFNGYEDREGRLWLYCFNGTLCYIKK